MKFAVASAGHAGFKAETDEIRDTAAPALFPELRSRDLAGTSFIHHSPGVCLLSRRSPPSS